MKKIIIFWSLFLLAIFLTACGTKIQTQSQVEKEAQKSVAEAVAAAQNKKGYFDLKQINEYKNLGAEFTLNFQTRDYDQSKAPIWDEYLKAAKIGLGQASYKIIKAKDQEKIGVWEPKQGNKFLAIYLEVKGKGNNSGQPRNFNQIGTDPAPSLYLVDKNGQQYSYQSAEASSLAFTENMKSMLSIKLTTSDWTKTVAVFNVPQNIAEPILVIKVKKSEIQYEYYGIKLF